MKRIVSLLIFTAVISVGQAQPPDPPAGGDPPCGGPFGPACIPIDGGVSLLVAAGLALGAKKTYDVSRRRKA
jgi:hypothetical protein